MKFEAITGVRNALINRRSALAPVNEDSDLFVFPRLTLRFISQNTANFVSSSQHHRENGFLCHSLVLVGYASLPIPIKDPEARS